MQTLGFIYRSEWDYAIQLNSEGGPRASVHAEYTCSPSQIQNIKEHSNSAL